jgi:hypothetical protein
MNDRKERIRALAKQIHHELKRTADLEEIVHTQAYCEICEQYVRPWDIHIIDSPEMETGTTQEKWACKHCVRKRQLPLANSQKALEFEAMRLAAKWIFLRA